MIFKIMFASFFLLFAPIEAHSWGSEGHQIVCAIALIKLTPQAKIMVDQLMEEGEALEGGRVSFTQSCLWPDYVKYRSYKGSYEQHFINVPNEANSINFSRDCAELNCLATGIQSALAYLVKPAVSRREKVRRAAAVRFLGHFIGDLHQPLHVGNASDWGGNKIEVKWRSKKTNLHAFWDSGMLKSIGITYPSSLNSLLSERVEESDKKKPVIEWFNESLSLARTNAYRDEKGSIIISGARIGTGYIRRNQPVLVKRLVLAGERLARMLNDVAAGKEPPIILGISR